MKIYCKIFSSIFTLTAAICAAGVHAAQTSNPRSAASVVVAAPRADGRDVRRSNATTAASHVSTVSRSAVTRPTNVVSRAATGRAGVAGAITSRSATSARQSVVGAARPDVTSARAATGVARSAVSARSAGGAARSATSVANVSRAATSRATAVFNDISKIGGGYATCREAYATCMDQFCANANDTYRRCFCSARFTEFRNTENAIDQAKILLQRFEDNNLNAVDKTAAEVNAMYSATVGEAAIKNDTSGAAALLAEIGDLLSGKTRVAAPANNTASGSLGIVSLDFSSDIDDIWGSSSTDSIFASVGGGTSDLSTMEGQELFNSASSQCLKIISDSCENSAVLNMAKSSYGILITQDCNAYEKKIDKQKEGVMQTVRTAEKYLREARLDEYRAHNSADVNECLTKVRTAMTAEVACGENYRRCLDYTGAYVNQSTGEVNYTPRLFKLSELIKLDGTSVDVLQQNAEFDSFLETRKMFANAALDTCRDIAPTVWYEFKRSALIEIAQAQDELIEEVKMSCISTMSECYDTQTNALKGFDTTTAQTAGALSAYAARKMCSDKVTACAALYGDTDGCVVGSDGKITAAKSGKTCGLKALLNFVDTVDNVRVAEGCASAIEKYVSTLCKPATGDMGAPWNCRTLTQTQLKGKIDEFAQDNCMSMLDSSETNMAAQIQTYVQKAADGVSEQLTYQLMEACEKLDGYWIPAGGQMLGGMAGSNNLRVLDAFYSSVYGGNKEQSWGTCYQNDTMVRCLAYNTQDSSKGDTQFATYDRVKDECNFSEEWYKQQCALMGNSYYENGICYVEPQK